MEKADSFGSCAAETSVIGGVVGEFLRGRGLRFFVAGGWMSGVLRIL